MKIFDKLYADSKSDKIFSTLMEAIRSEENIKLEHRNIKKNTGSNTGKVNELTIKNVVSKPCGKRRHGTSQKQ